MAQEDSNSIGTLPQVVIARPDGGFGEAPPPVAAPTQTSTSDAIEKTAEHLVAGLGDPNQDDTLIAGCKELGQLIDMRVDPGVPLRDVPRPADAETMLVETAEHTAEALEGDAAVAVLVPVEPKRLKRRAVQLRRVRKIRDAFVPLVTNLDLVIRNLEDGLDSDLRTVFRHTSSLIDNNKRVGDAFGKLKAWATRQGQRAAASRRKNARRDAMRNDAPETTATPAPAATPPPAPQPAVVTPVTPAPLPLAGRAAPTAPRRRTRAR